jgi:hypothetical protein
VEGDKQDVFITSLTISGNSLMIEDERGQHYAMNLATREISKT